MMSPRLRALNMPMPKSTVNFSPASPEAAFTPSFCWALNMPMLKFTVDFGMGMFNALNLGDIMNEMIYRIRPYEVQKGRTDEVFQASIDELCTLLRDRKPFEDHEDLPEWMAEKIRPNKGKKWEIRSEEHTSELQSLRHLVCRLL